jgi:hypothetical protein
VRKVVRRYRAAVTLGEKALLYERHVKDGESQARLMRSLGIKTLL